MKLKNKLAAWGGALLVSLAAVACSGNTDEDADMSLVLTVDKVSIEANGRDEATFTVKQAEADVTSKAEIRCVTTGEAVQGGKFATSEEGTFAFEATYNGQTSSQVAVTAAKVQASQFVRQVCIMEFTATECSFCPEGYRQLVFLTNGYDEAHLMAVHPLNYNGTPDPMGIPQENDLRQAFKVSSYPNTLVDMREVAAANATEFTPAFERSLNDYPAYCGVAVSSEYAAGASQATVTVKLHAEKAGEYRIVLYAVEDNIRGYQLDGGKKEPNYLHRHVTRKLVNPSIYGESLGTVSAGTEATKTWTVDLEADWKVEDLSFYALALDADGTVNNMNVCAADGGDSGYWYEEQK